MAGAAARLDRGRVIVELQAAERIEGDCVDVIDQGRVVLAVPGATSEMPVLPPSGIHENEVEVLHPGWEVRAERPTRLEDVARPEPVTRATP